MDRTRQLLTSLGLVAPVPPPSNSVKARLTPGSFVLAVLPDTQVYSRRYPGTFDAQTAWLAARGAELGIRYVLHVGDLVDRNSPREWRRAVKAMSRLDGVLPYAIVTGNHDQGPSGNASTRESGLNDHFSFAKVAAWPTFGGAHEPGRLDNTYHLFSAAGRDFVVLCLEWGPRDRVLAWANGVMSAHPERLGILVTHAYLYEDGLRYDDGRPSRQNHHPRTYGTAGGVTDGEEIWQTLVRRHPFVLVLSGHVLGRGVARLSSTTDRGTTCHQLLANFQMRRGGGEGYLRLLEFLPDAPLIRVFSYSPLQDEFLRGDEHEFSLPFPCRTNGATGSR